MPSRHTSVTLYVLTASHPCLAVELMLRRKALEYRRAELPLIVSRAMRFPRRTLPALRVGDRRVQGSRAIARALEQLRPDPPLFPRDAIARERVEEAALRRATAGRARGGSRSGASAATAPASRSTPANADCRVGRAASALPRPASTAASAYGSGRALPRWACSRQSSIWSVLGLAPDMLAITRERQRGSTRRSRHFASAEWSVADHPAHLIHRYRIPREVHDPPRGPRRGIGRRIAAGR
jgi:glutathione S-transferase